MKFSCAPAYGFGKSKKLELSKNDQLLTPGPGSYIPNKLIHELPSWKMGTSQRPKLPNLENPGPGAYNIRYKFPDGPSYSIVKPTKLFKDILEKDSGPGPGSYNLSNPNDRNLKNSYSFGQKYKENERELSPGPGKYNLRTDRDLLVPSTVFGREKKLSNNITDSPGPGRYNTDVINSNYQKPKYSFGKEKRILDNIIDSPGPGTYETKEYVGREGTKISMGLKYNSKVDEYNPGPGQYETNNYNNIIFKKLPDIILGKANRFSSNINDSPGPGRYNSVDLGKYNKLNPSWKMGTSERKSLGSITDSPGPGRYDLRKNLGENSPQYSMGKREKDSDNKFVSPGPGRYNNDEFNTYKRYPAWKMGTGKRDDDLRRQIREGFPGPGAYKYNDLYLQSYPKYKFGTEERVKDKNNGIPGPGSYHIPCSIVDVNSYTREQGVFDDKFKFI